MTWFQDGRESEGVSIAHRSRQLGFCVKKREIRTISLSLPALVLRRPPVHPSSEPPSCIAIVHPSTHEYDTSERVRKRRGRGEVEGKKNGGRKGDTDCEDEQEHLSGNHGIVFKSF